MTDIGPIRVATVDDAAREQAMVDEIERLRDALQSIANHVEANAQTSALAKAIFVTCRNALNYSEAS